MRYRAIIRLFGITGLLLGCARAGAQSAELVGTVVDAGSGHPVPFAVIEIPGRHVGVQATVQGTFVLPLPRTPLAPTDSLRVTSLGFATRQFAVPPASPCQLALRAVALALPEATVRPPAQPVVLGPAAAAGRTGFSGGNLHAVSSQGWQIARQFVGGPSGSIVAVRFLVKPNAHCGRASLKAPFRVRLYAADGPAGAPGTDLLAASVLTAASRAGWYEVDLRRYHPQTPATGFFVAMEWLYTSAAFGCEYTYYAPNAKAKMTDYAYGQTLGGYYDNAPPLTWYLSAGSPWQRFTPRALPDGANHHENHNAAIQALIQPD